jgi:hypothetical protein
MPSEVFVLYLGYLTYSLGLTLAAFGAVFLIVLGCVAWEERRNG